MIKSRYQFVAADYSATGEGRTVSLLVTCAYPNDTDYEGSYPNQVEINTPEFRACREFIEKCDPYIAQGIKILTEEEFLRLFGHMLPTFVKDMILEQNSESPGNFNWYSTFHVNFS